MIVWLYGMVGVVVVFVVWHGFVVRWLYSHMMPRHKSRRKNRAKQVVRYLGDYEVRTFK